MLDRIINITAEFERYEKNNFEQKIYIGSKFNQKIEENKFNINLI